MSALISAVVVVSCALGAVQPAPAGDEAIEQLGQAVVGVWAGEYLVADDAPGLGKKGETLPAWARVDFVVERRVLECTWGVGSLAGRSITFRDPRTKKLRTVELDSDGNVDLAEVSKVGEHWVWKWVYLAPDGARTEETDTLVVLDGGNSHRHELTQRSRNGGRLSDSKAVYRRVATGNLPPEVLDFLLARSGDWKVAGMAGRDRIDGRFSNRWAPGGYALQWTATLARGQSTDHGVGLLGWDAAAKKTVESQHWNSGYAYWHYYALQSPTRWESTESRVVDPAGKSIHGKVASENLSPTEFAWTFQPAADNGASVSDPVRLAFTRIEPSQTAEALKTFREYGRTVAGDWKCSITPWVDRTKQEAKRAEVRCSLAWTLGGTAIEERLLGLDGGFRGFEFWDPAEKCIRRIYADAQGGMGEGRIAKQGDHWFFQEKRWDPAGKLQTHSVAMSGEIGGDRIVFEHREVVVDGVSQQPYKDEFRRVKLEAK